MKLLKILLPILALLLMSGCRKHYINGDLDGQWQVLTIEYKSDGSVDNVKAKQIYYCFNLHTVNLRQSKASPSILAGNMKYDKKSLTLEFPTVNNPSELSAWGMNSPSTTFTMRHLTGEKLVMESDYAVVSCRKF